MFKLYPGWFADEYGLADLNELDYKTFDKELIIECLISPIRADILLLTMSEVKIGA